MEIHSVEIHVNKKSSVVSGKTTRLELISLFGKPDDIGGFSGNKKRGQILKYGNTEFHFIGDEDSDTLFLIYREHPDLEENFPEISIRFQENKK